MKLKFIIVILGLFLLFNITGCEFSETLRQEGLERQRQEDIKEQEKFYRFKANKEVILEVNKEIILDLVKNKSYSNSISFAESAILFYGLMHSKDTYLFDCSKCILPLYDEGQPIYFSLLNFKEHTTCLYIGKNTLGLQIFQYLPKEKGSLVKLTDSEDFIFIRGLQGVNGQIFKRKFTLLYLGTYSYNTGLNTLKKVHSFYEPFSPEFYKDLEFYVNTYNYDKKFNENKFFKEEVWPALEIQKEKMVQKFEIFS